MVDQERQLTIVEQFEDSPIRKIWHEGEWWYSLVDIMSFIVGSNRAGKYWYDLKKRLMEEEANKSLLANIKQLKIQSTDSKYYKSDMANLATARRILQSASLPSRRRFLQPTHSEIEKNIEDALANDLRNQGFAVKQQVCCASGRADIVTNEAIYEVKAFLTRDCIYKAIGQLFSYQRSINPSANLFIVGCKPRNNGEQKIETSLATSLGIEVMVWDWNNLELSAQSGMFPFQTDGGKVGGRARADLESQGLKVVSEQNYLHTEKSQPQIAEASRQRLVNYPLGSKATARQGTRKGYLYNDERA